MNAKVQEFINQKKQEEKKKRDEHLISLGLVTGEKTIQREYLEYYVYGATLDEESERYYFEHEIEHAIDVSEEEYQEILKYSSVTKKKEIDYKWANIIEKVAKTFLFINIFCGIILCIVFANNYHLEDFIWIPIVWTIVYCGIYFPFMMGFSKMVAMAEKDLQS
ncbi:MAG: hypothetical protein IJ352_00850 [Muribaculaceae bacterium]|nr:hypothetical protein [Muribaculaceae bacterium]